MHPHRRSDARTGRAGAGRVVERELGRVHLAGDQVMPRAAEAGIELLVLGAGLFRFRDVKAEQAVAEFQSVFERRHDLMVDSRADVKRVDHRFDRVSPIFVQFDMVAQVVRLAVNPRSPIAVHANLIEQILKIFAVDLKHWRPHFHFRAFGQR
jgi:hypothetical protein